METDWTLSFPPGIIYYILIPILIVSIPAVFAWLKRQDVSAVRNYILEELKQDVKDLKARVSRLELGGR